MEKQLNQVEIEDRFCIPFVNKTDNLGRAEFILCPLYKRGKVVELFIYRRQQQNVTEYYHWEHTGRGVGEMTIQSFGDLPDPKVWRTFYCKEHKTQSLELYVPVGATYLRFEQFSFCITLGFMTDKK